jgi:hypothetical protein
LNIIFSALSFPVFCIVILIVFFSFIFGDVELISLEKTIFGCCVVNVRNNAGFSVGP